MTVGKGVSFSLSSISLALPLPMVLTPTEKGEGIFRPFFSVSYFGMLVASVSDLAQT